MKRSDLYGLAVLTAVLGLFPVVAPPALVNTGVYALIYAISAIGLTLLMGLAGQVSLGHAAFFAIGAYTQAILVTRYGVPLPVAALAAIALAMLTALLLGLPLLRLRGHFLALATLGLGIVLSVTVNELEFTGATSGIFGIPKPEFGGRSYDSPEEFFWLLIPFVLLGLILARGIVESRVGRALGAVNDSEVAAESLGVDTFRLRLQVFVLSAGYAGLGGVFFAHWLGVVSPSSANFPMSVEFLLISVLGGLGTVWGAVIGAFAVEFLDEAMRQFIPMLIDGAAGEVQLIGFGLVLVLIVVLMPGGLHQACRLGMAKVMTRGGRGAGPAPVPEAGPVPARRPRPEPDGPLLDVHGLIKRFGGVVAVDDVSFDVRAGEIVALIGPNGAGKTTCFNMISGVLEPSSGEVTVNGVRTDGRRPHVFARAGATRTFQNLQVFRSSTVLGNVKVGRHLRSRAGLLRGAFVLPARAEEQVVTSAAIGALESVGLAEQGGRMAVDLPFGQQRRMEIARALALEPDLLLLDEPMAGLSGSERRELATLLRELREDGMAIVLVEHDVAAVLSLADRVAVLDDGKLIAFGTPEAIRHDPAVITAYLGEDADVEGEAGADVEAGAEAGAEADVRD